MRQEVRRHLIKLALRNPKLGKWCVLVHTPFQFEFLRHSTTGRADLRGNLADCHVRGECGDCDCIASWLQNPTCGDEEGQRDKGSD
jgi:hypothetical protein